MCRPAGVSAYAMSKAAVGALAASLRGEVLADGVGVVLVSPGFVESEIRQVDNRGVLHPGARDAVPRWLVVPAAVRPASSCARSPVGGARWSSRGMARWRCGCPGTCPGSSLSRSRAACTERVASRPAPVEAGFPPGRCDRLSVGGQ